MRKYLIPLTECKVFVLWLRNNGIDIATLDTEQLIELWNRFLAIKDAAANQS